MYITASDIYQRSIIIFFVIILSPTLCKFFFKKYYTIKCKPWELQIKISGNYDKWIMLIVT